MIIDKAIETFTPSRGLFGGSLSFILGIMSKFDMQTMAFVSFCFQITAFTITILVGILTFVHIHMKFIDRRRARKNEK